MTLDEAAAGLTKRINATIESRCRAASPLQWRAIADDVAEKLTVDRWEWLVAEPIGGIPHVVLTRYTRPEPFEETMEPYLGE